MVAWYRVVAVDDGTVLDAMLSILEFPLFLFNASPSGRIWSCFRVRLSLEVGCSLLMVIFSTSGVALAIDDGLQDMPLLEFPF